MARNILINDLDSADKKYRILSNITNPVNGKINRTLFSTALKNVSTLVVDNHIISKYIPQFLVFYTPQGGTKRSYRSSGVRY